MKCLNGSVASQGKSFDYMQILFSGVNFNCTNTNSGDTSKLIVIVKTFQNK